MLEGYPWGNPEPRVVRMFIRFRELANAAQIRSYLGLTLTEWEEQPETFQRWALQFYRVEVDMARANRDDDG